MDRIVIIGGGASGIVASIFAKRKHNQVIVLERNSAPLKKILMTGNGRCNYLNECYHEDFYTSEDSDLISSILRSEHIQSVKDFFERLGVVPKIKNGYYYPFSSQAVTIKNVLLNEAKRLGVEIHLSSLVTNIEKNGSHFLVTCEDEEIQCDKVIMATGSSAYPKTGSDGMGYSFLKQFHFSLIEPLPGLVPLFAKKKYPKWDGVRSDVAIELFEDGEFMAREEGEIQCTSYGVSGICIFNLSNRISRGLSLGKKEEIHIHFAPFIQTLITPWMNDYAKKCPHKTLEELLGGFLNEKLASVLIEESNLSPTDFYLELSNEQKLRLCKNIRSFSLEIVGTKGFDSSQICIGGVRLKDLDVHTMESKKVKGLYVVGELLDMNGQCGGYNLTTCWISGMLAGSSCGGKDD